MQQRVGTVEMCEERSGGGQLGVSWRFYTCNQVLNQFTIVVLGFFFVEGV